MIGLAIGGNPRDKGSWSRHQWFHSSIPRSPKFLRSLPLDNSQCQNVSNNNIQTRWIENEGECRIRNGWFSDETDFNVHVFYLCDLARKMEGKEQYNSNTWKGLVWFRKDITICIPTRRTVEMTTRTCDLQLDSFTLKRNACNLFVSLLFSTKHIHKTRTKPLWTLGLVVLMGATDLNCLQPCCGTPKMNYQYTFKFTGRNPLLPRYLKSKLYVLCAAFGAGWNQVWGSKSPIRWVVSSMTIEILRVLRVVDLSC